MRPFTFDDYSEMKSAFKEKIDSKEEKKVEHCVLKNFERNKVLFTAPHAEVGRKYVKRNGKGVYFGIGDKNTGKLAKIAALKTNTAYVIPKVLRTKADPARPPEKLGEGLKLRAPLLGAESEKSISKTERIEIHKSKKHRYVLERYHNVIKKLEPRAVVFIHGMRKDRKFDILLGFGEDDMTIGGKKNAFEFRRRLRKRIEEYFQAFGIKEKLKVGVSRKLFRGRKNYPLKNHVIDYNKKHKNKRIGINVEFNLKGRITEKNVNLPSIKYQLATEALADLIVERSKS